MVKRVLITGISGLIGGILQNELSRDHEITGLARRKMTGPRCFSGDIKDLKDILPIFKDQDAVVHLAADASVSAPWESILPNNIVGTYNVFEACRLNGVKQVVYASSNHVTGMYERDYPYHHLVRGEYEKLDELSVPKISHRSEIRPDSYYGISKAYGEAMGRYYSEEHKISVVCLRIGTVNKWDTPLRSRRHFSTWLSHRDLVQLVRRSLKAQGVTFDIFYGVSGNKWRFWDIEHAKEVIGYEPEDDAERLRG